MAQGTKIRWRPEEEAAAASPDFFYVKQAVIRHVQELFNECGTLLTGTARAYPELEPFARISSHRIFRGENYLQLPYVVLDYPRLFSAQSVFAFRTMFWWGKHFSCTLHLQGEALRQFRIPLQNRLDELKGKNFYWCIHSSPWHYHFEADNFIPLDPLLNSGDRGGDWNQRTFIKLSRRLPVADYGAVPDFAVETFGMLAGLLKEKSG